MVVIGAKHSRVWRVNRYATTALQPHVFLVMRLYRKHLVKKFGKGASSDFVFYSTKQVVRRLEVTINRGSVSQLTGRYKSQRKASSQR